MTTSTSTPAALARAFADTREVLAGITPDQLEHPTPCQSWDVHALINHVVAAPRFAAGAVSAGTGGEAPPDDFAAGDFLAAHDEAAKMAVTAFGTDDALTKTISLPFAEVPGSFLMMMVLSDQLTHAWDLARATGQSTDLDPELARECLPMLRGVVTDAFRGADREAAFGPERSAPPGASAADEMAAFLGRTV